MDRLTPAALPDGWRFPASRAFDLDSGLHVKLVDLPGRLVAAVGVAVALPTAVEQPGTEGAVSALTAMLLSDAPHARAGRVGPLDRVGATITVGCDHRGPKVMADCPIPDLPVLLDTLADMLLGFEPSRSSFDAWHRQVAAERQAETRDPIALANRLFSRSVLPADSRYARSIGGEDDAGLTADYIAALYDRHVGPRVMTMVIVGDLRGTDVESAVRSAFGRHHPKDCVPGIDRPPTPGAAPRLWHRRVAAGGGQTRIMIGSFGIDRQDPRWPAARLTAELLGGGTDALLNRELRGNLSVSYGFDVRFIPYTAGGLFLVSGSVAEDRSEQAVAVICDLLTRIAAGDVDEKSFATTRNRMTAGAPITFETALAVAQQHLELASSGIDESFIDRHLSEIAMLDPQRWAADVRTLIEPGNLHAVVVGRFDPDASALSGVARG